MAGYVPQFNLAGTRRNGQGVAVWSERPPPVRVRVDKRQRYQPDDQPPRLLVWRGCLLGSVSGTISAMPGRAAFSPEDDLTELNGWALQRFRLYGARALSARRTYDYVMDSQVTESGSP
jgi:hypothetical protein